MSNEPLDTSVFVEFGRSVLEKEGRAVLALAESVAEDFGAACAAVAGCRGAVAVSGVGKSGIVGRKISATLASAGVRSYWLDPLNAMHGDLGMVSSNDVALLLSNSGTSDEILNVARALGGLGALRIAMTRDSGTDLARLCEHTLAIGNLEEACPLRLAPSTSTTAMLALGDALALAVQSVKGFTEREYAVFHPAGALGRRLRQVRDVMRRGDRVATAGPETPVARAISLVTERRCGACLVTDESGRLLGIYTDGDFRRDMNSGRDVSAATLGECMSAECKRIRGRASVGEALEMMRAFHINALPVVDENDVVQGLLDIQDIV